MILFWLAFSGFALGLILFASILYFKLGDKVFITYGVFLTIILASFLIIPQDIKYFLIAFAAISSFAFYFLTKNLVVQFSKFSKIRLILNLTAAILLVLYVIATVLEDPTAASFVVAFFVVSLFAFAYSAILNLDFRVGKTA